jgi:hypothetical protein
VQLRRSEPAVAPSAPASARPVQADGQCGQHLGGLVSMFGSGSTKGKGAGGGARRGRAEATGGEARHGGGVACAREWPASPFIGDVLYAAKPPGRGLGTCRRTGRLQARHDPTH